MIAGLYSWLIIYLCANACVTRVTEFYQPTITRPIRGSEETLVYVHVTIFVVVNFERFTLLYKFQLTMELNAFLSGL